MFQKTILVVDDGAVIRAALRVALQHAGFRVVEAENGRAALTRAREHLPDVVLVDLMMPVLDGWQTVRVLRQDPRTESIPVIAMTAIDGVAAAELARAGFCSHLRKPFTLAQVVGEIGRFLASGSCSATEGPCRGAECAPRHAA